METQESRNDSGAASTPGLSEADEHLLLDELHLVQKMMADADAAYGQWEAWFIAAHGILAVAAMHALGQPEPLAGAAIALLGACLSLLFVAIQGGNRIYARARMKRWKRIEGRLNREIDTHTEYMAILKSQEEEIARHFWYRALDELLTTWGMRQLVPVLFLLFWIMFAVFVV